MVYFKVANINRPFAVAVAPQQLHSVQLLWSYDYSKWAILTKNQHFTIENFKFQEAVKVENFCTRLPKGTPLRQIGSNKSFGVCGIDVVLTLYGGEKKVEEESAMI